MSDFVYPFSNFQTLLAMGYRNNLLSGRRFTDEIYSNSLNENKKTLETNFLKEAFYKNMQIEKLMSATVDTKPTKNTKVDDYVILISDGQIEWHPNLRYSSKRYIRTFDYFDSNNNFSLYQNYCKRNNRLGDLAYLNCISPIGISITGNIDTKVTYSSLAKGSLDCNVIFVDISKGKKVRLQEDFVNDNIMLTKIYYIIREGASLELIRDHSKSNYNVIESCVVQHPNSKFYADISSNFGTYSQDIFDIDSYKNCTSYFYSRSMIADNTSNNVSVNINHYGKNSKSLIDVKTVLDDKSYSSFRGNINIVKKAENVSAKMINKNLLLSNEAVAVTEPNLDINTKEVECSHGCTISNIDKDVLYYLNSRGYNDTQAKQTIIQGFLSK